MIPLLSKVWPTFARGSTITITSAFFDAGNHSVQPGTTPQVNIVFNNTSGQSTSTLVVMSQNAQGVWSAEWDSRGAAAGVVFWSVEAPGSIPVSVEDGQFTLEANPANKPSF